MIEQDLLVRIVDDRILDDFIADDVTHLLRHHDHLSVMFTYRLVEILDELRRTALRDGFPRLLDKDHFPLVRLQAPHLGDVRIHQHDCHDREKNLMVLDVIQLKDDEPLMEQVHLLLRIQQILILAPLRIWGEHLN